MKIFILSMLLLFSFTKTICQNKTIDSLNQQLTVVKNDTVKVTLTTTILVFLIIGFFLFRSKRYKQKTYTLLQQQRQEIEIQNAKAQIEAALEQARARAIAMHNNKDISDAIAVLFSDLDKLGISTIRCGIYIFDESDNAELWTAISTKESKVSQVSGKLDMTVHPMLRGILNAWKEEKLFFLYELSGEDRQNYYKSFATSNDYAIPIQNKEGETFSTNREFCSVFFFREGCLFTFTSQAFSDEKKFVLEKFASVFGLTYRRYFDLKQAEELARETAIEAALEKVREKAMAMHNSNDLSATASMVFTELRKLGINPIRCGVGILEKESRKGQLYSTVSSKDGDTLALVGWVLLSGHPVLENIYEAQVRGEDCFPQLSGEQLRSYYEILLSGLSLPTPNWQPGEKQYGHFLTISVGMFYAWSHLPYNDSEIKILKRFALIIDLTFRRYIELKTSEANAREAVRRASLDRVRAEIASMRTTADLERITPLIWNELMTLGVPFIRCGVFIMDEQNEQIHTFLSTPEGKAIAAFNLPYNTSKTSALVLEHWRKKETYKEHWDEAAFIEWTNRLVEQGVISSQEKYLTENRPANLDLYFLPFLQGMLYVGNDAPLRNDEIHLVQTLADAFSTAYARYEDFNKLESAKAQVEKTIVDLKQAQAQLVQSEKMASLGELTAGIAHEIQNPLNFVNNFSEVSNELLDEMITKLGNNNKEDAIAIADDVKQNLEKILHHGKRADGIVKGMLQHSRTGSGIKESTDINKLADEYLRLAYHGLKAKDKSFNATLKTDYDETIGNINIIPQDIGRAILNLITNAFYAVTEKKKVLGTAKGGVEYEPTVSLSTKKINGKVEIRVADNGNGIPQKVLDKIFHPFFTTKPTGQGTGLGLSLSYDIAKARGGEIKVETKENEGAEFIIQLPV